MTAPRLTFGKQDEGRLFRIPTSKTGWPRTRSKPFSPRADRLIDCDRSNGDAGSDVEEEDGDSYELGPSNRYHEADRFSDMGNDMWL